MLKIKSDTKKESASAQFWHAICEVYQGNGLTDDELLAVADVETRCCGTLYFDTLDVEDTVVGRTLYGCCVDVFYTSRLFEFVLDGFLGCFGAVVDDAEVVGDNPVFFKIFTFSFGDSDEEVAGCFHIDDCMSAVQTQTEPFASLVDILRVVEGVS